jgi:predicted CoA-binding protein
MNTALTADERERYQNADTIREILETAKTVAIVGLSTDRQKASYFVASYLLAEGYRVIPVTPRGGEILGQKCYPDLKSVPDKIDLVDVFRPAHEVAGIVESALELHIPAVWLQLRIIDFAAADRALAAGCHIIMDKCVKMEHGRYGGSLHWAGMNTEIITARRARR